MLALLAVLLVMPAEARAQDEPSAVEVTLARRQFEEGMTAARASRWEEARAAFERAYELVHRPRILANLATAQAHTGQLVEAAESYRRFLRETTTGPERSARPAVERELAALEPRIPEVWITITGLLPEDRLLLDGQELSRAALGVAVPVNPGPHRFVVQRRGVELDGASFELTEGQRLPVPLDLTAGSIAPAPAAPVILDAQPEESSTDEPGGGGILSSPIFWIATGAVVVLAILGGILVAGGESAPPSGNFGSGRWTIE